MLKPPICRVGGKSKLRKTITKGPFLVISYMNKDNGIKNITFDVSAALVKSVAKTSKNEVKKELIMNQ